MCLEKCLDSKRHFYSVLKLKSTQLTKKKYM